MKVETLRRATTQRQIIKKCHVCGEIIESFEEIRRCPSCKKAFLPVNYFQKCQAKNSEEFESMFSPVEELQETDLIRGLNVLW